MSEQECITLAIPNHNGAQYLRQTLESLAGNRPFVRWWLQDNQSSDDSLEIARELARPGDVIRAEPDKGQADALNTAFAQMGGQIIGFINSDDCLTPGAAEAVLNVFRENPETDLVYGEVEWIDAGGHSAGIHRGRIATIEDILDIYHIWFQERQWVQPEVFWRRSLFEKVGCFDTRYRLAFDYDFWVRCFKAGARVKRLPKILAKFRLHPQQKSRAARDAAAEIRDVLREHLAAGVPGANPLWVAHLRNRLEYDRYQSAQDYADPRQRPSFPQALLRRPCWLLLPEVQRRLRKSLLRY